jgi:hypothetical protein
VVRLAAFDRGPDRRVFGETSIADRILDAGVILENDPPGADIHMPHL